MRPWKYGPGRMAMIFRRGRVPQAFLGPNGALIRLNKPGFFRKVGVKVGPSGDPCLGLAVGSRFWQRAQTMKNARKGAPWPLATDVGCCQQDRPGRPRGHTVATPDPRRSLAVDNNVIYGEATARLRRGSGTMPGRVGYANVVRIEFLQVWGAERGGAVPDRA
jgi:hypothetical protein